MTADWQQPGAHPVAPGIHRIPLPLPQDGLRAVNVYAVDRRDGLVLIDAGWALDESREPLERRWRRSAHGLADIRQFLVTHVHRDHYTQAVAIRREFGTRVSLGVGERPTLEAAERHPDRRPSPAPAAAPVRRGRAARPADRPRLATAGTTRPTGSRRTTGSTDGRRWPSASGRCGRSPRPGTPRATSSSPTGRPGCCSPATTCCRTSRRRSGSRPARPTLAAGRLPALAAAGARRCPTCGCCRRTARSPTSVHARVDELLDHHEHRLAEPRRAVAGRRGHRVRGGPAAELDPAEAARSPISIRSTRCSRSARPPRTCSYSPPSAGCGTPQWTVWTTSNPDPAG